jgi:DNA polymerase III epsilon subunit-like protein
MWVDVETTGLNSYRNGIIQLSGMIERDNEIIEEFNYRIAPFPFDMIDPKALEVNGKSRSEIQTYEKPMKVYKEFKSLVEKHANGAKLICAGYNVGFDVRFVKDFFGKNGDKNFFSHFDYHTLDVMNSALMYCHKKSLKLKNVKLVTVAEHFGVNADFHDAMNDIRATREVYLRILEALG